MHPAHAPANTADRRLFYWFAAPAVLFDQLTKWLIIQALPLNTSHTPFPALDPFFRLSHVANFGGVFGMFQGTTAIFAGLAALVSAGLLYYNHALPIRATKLRMALGVVLGGALGNLIDRIHLGYVTDFLDFDVSSWINIPFADWPVFNFADVAIVSGIVIMAYLTIFAPHEIEPPAAPPAQPPADSPPTP